MEGRPRQGEAGVAGEEKVGGVHGGRRMEKDWIFGVAGGGGGVGAEKRRSWRGGWMARRLDGARATVANGFFLSFF